MAFWRAVLFVIGSFLACGAYAQPSAEAPVSIGLVLPLSGIAEFWGVQSRNGALLALEDLNREPGARINLVFEDGRCNPRAATTAARKLFDADGVQMLIGEVCSTTTLSIAPISESSHRVQIAHCSEAKALDDAGDYVFRLWPSNEMQARTLASHALEARKLKRVVIFAVQNDYSESFVQAFREQFGQKGGEVVRVFDYLPTAEDFRAEVAKAKALHPDAVVLSSYPKDGVTLVRQLKELKLNVPILVTASMNSGADVFVPLGADAEGLIFSDVKDVTDAAYRRRFEERYATKWPGATSCAATGYDAVMLLGKAARSAGNNADRIREFLLSQRGISGVSGPLDFDAKGNLQREFIVYTVVRGEAQPVEP